MWIIKFSSNTVQAKRQKERKPTKILENYGARPVTLDKKNIYILLLRGHDINNARLCDNYPAAAR